MRLLRALLILAFAVTPMAAQSRLSAETEVRSSPDGAVVATLRSGTSWSTGETRSGFTLVVIQGWVEASRFAGPRDTFPQSIGGTNTLRIREEPSLSGRILGEFRGGAGLRVVERRGNWARIRRDVWAPAGSIVATAARNAAPAGGGRAGAAAPRAPAGGAAPANPTTGAGSPSPANAAARDSVTAQPRTSAALRAEAPVSLRAAPAGNVLGELAAGSVVEPQARDRGWVKVRIEAWVAESLFVPADTAYATSLSAADLRIDPDGHKGKVVRWEVQVAGLQKADPLRRDLRPEEPFLLAMGPTGEDAILYIAVPPALLNDARAISPLERVTLTARIRTGRSQPTGVPVLELISLIRR
jgi:hypothetical protein